MQKKAVTLLFAAGLASGLATGADLLSAYGDAVGYDPQFAGARASLKAGQEKLPQGLAGLLPTIALSANTNLNNVDFRERLPASADTSLKYNAYGWSVTLTQPLFRWQNWEAYNQSQLQLALAEAQFEAARQDLMVRVAQAYFDVVQAREMVATVEAQKAAIAGQVRVAKRSFEIGTVTVVDIHEAQSRFDLASATEIAARNDLLVKQQALRKLTGKIETSSRNLRSGVAIPEPQPNNMDRWVESSEQANPVVKSALAGYEIAVREAGKQRAGHYPTLDLVASSALNSAAASPPSNIGAETRATTIGLQLTVPLFAGGSTASRGREAVALQEKARADLDNAKLGAALQTRQAFLDVTSGLAQVKAYEAALASSQSALDSNRSGYEVGVRLNIDVLNAQSQLYDTRQKLVKARVDAVVALLRLKAATGALVEDDMKAINALLE